MNLWIIAVIAGLLIVAGIAAASFSITATEKVPCSSCGNTCSAEKNCGLESCGTVNGGKCGCGG